MFILHFIIQRPIRGVVCLLVNFVLQLDQIILDIQWFVKLDEGLTFKIVSFVDNANDKFKLLIELCKLAIYIIMVNLNG